MSAPTAPSKEPKVIDLTKDNEGKTPKRQTQMRLPFAKIDKNAALAKMENEVKKLSEEAKKRKLSEEDKDLPVEEAKTAENTQSSNGAMKVKIGSAKKKPRMEDSNTPKSPSMKEKAKTPSKSVAGDKDTKSPSNHTAKGNAKKKPKMEDSKTEKSVTEEKANSPSKPPAIADKDANSSPNPKPIEDNKTPQKMVSPKSSPKAKIEVATPTTSSIIQDIFPKTPETQGKRKASDSTPETSEKVKKMTPKQLARKAELEKKREEKEKAKEEARLAKEAEKSKEKERKEAEKEKERLQKEQEKLEKEKIKQEKLEEKARLKQEKEAEKAKEKERKEAEKEKERLEKERAKQEKLEAKEKKEKEEKLKAEKLKQSFASFFVKKDTHKDSENETMEVVSSNGLNQFRVKQNMKLAPLVRSTQFGKNSKTKLDNSINSNVEKCALYVSLMKKGSTKGQSMGKTWPYTSKKVEDDDVEIIEEEEDDLLGDEIQEEQEIKQVKLKSVYRRAKLLQFCENQRPAYFGTWSKKTSKVGPRKPFAMDSEYFDYDYDSDEDWEEEEQGESLSDEEKDKEEDENEAAKDNEDEDDDGFFVGHGVLDKDELKTAEDEDDEAFDEELEIKKQKLKAQKFEEEYKKKKPNKLKPRVFGCFWNDPVNANSKDNELKIAYEQLIKILNPFKAVSLTLTSIIPTTISEPNCEESKDNSPKTEKSGGKSSNTPKPLKQVPEEAMPHLIRLVHANTNNKVFMAKEFVHFWSTRNEDQPIPKSKVLQKLQEIADYQKSETLSRKCWLVKTEVLQAYGIAQPDVPNKWEYSLEQPNKNANTPTTPAGTTPAKTIDKSANETPKSEKITERTGNLRERPPPASLITKFTKVLSEEERLKALKDAAEKAKSDKDLAASKEKAVQSNSKPPAPQGTPKRIQPTLIDLTKN